MANIKDFQILSKLGEGAYSTVYKVKRLHDAQEYALKKVKLGNLSDKEKQNALNEVRILASISHTNMIAYKEAFLDEGSNSLCIVMEYANNGDLFQKICEHQKKGTNFQEPEIWNIFIQMVNALKALHDLKIFHRDLKSANVFLNKDGTVKLGDLNVSKVAKKGLLYTQTGTPYYASPEVWRDMPYDSKSDVWSLGCVLYEITTLNPPFRAEDMEGLYKKVLKGYYPRIPTHYSQDLSNLIRALLQVSPHLRPSCNKILQLPSIGKRMEERHLVEIEEGQQSALLETIRVPKNLRFLTEKLPKANYSLLKTRKIDKNRFLQTLAGHKDHSSNQSLIGEDGIRGSESVDSYKKDKEHGRIYLPPVGKEGGHDIAKIYGAKKKEKKVPAMNAPRPNIADDEYEGPSSEARKQADIKKKIKNLEKEIKEEERDASLKRSERKASNHALDHRIAYKVHNLNQDADFEHHGPTVRGIHGGRPNPRAMVDPLEDKDPVQAIIKKHRNHLRREQSPDRGDYASEPPKKQSKLPPLSQDKSGKLPPLNAEKGYENSASPKKKKLKELSKVYKVNIGEMDDLSEKYAALLGKPAKKDPLVPIGKKYGGYPSHPLNYGVNGNKYGKGYDAY